MIDLPYFISFAQLEAYLYQLGDFRVKPDLARVRDVLSNLNARRLPGVTVQIVGTNGKGSTTTFLASLGQAAGLKTGLFLSPHFVSFRERIRINGAMLPKEDWVSLANRVMAMGGQTLTYFEFATAVGALAFLEARVDLAAMETGLGGSWDAVSAMEADLVLFTPVSFDHCHILGDTIAAIAEGKAGAIRPGKPVVSAPQEEAAHRVLAAHAARMNAPLYDSVPAHSLPPSILDGSVPMRLGGRHQFINAALALDAWRMLVQRYGWASAAAMELDGLISAFIPGRLQFVPSSERYGHPALLLDGAHNMHGMSVLGSALAERRIAPASVIFACLRDKAPQDMVAHLRILSTGPIFVPPIPGNPRAMPPEELAALIGLNASPVNSMAQGMELAVTHVAERMPREAAVRPEQHPVLICGSLYLLGDFYTLRPDCLEPSSQSASYPS